MEKELIKAPQQNEMQPTWKLLYEADWEQGFNTFMLILAQQYKIELMIQIGNQKQPSPVIEFWRERLRGLSPKQMTEGLRGWMGCDQGSFQPNPENIRFYAEEIIADDMPRRRINPNCEACGGIGQKANDGRMYRDWNGRDKFKMIPCDCVVVEYRGSSFKSEQKALPEVVHKIEPKELLQRIGKKTGVTLEKKFPARREQSESDYNHRQDELRQQAEMLKADKP